MRTLVSVKKDMEFNKGLSLLIETLKSIAIAQYYMMEKRSNVFKEFFPSIESFLKDIDMDTVNHVFMKAKGRAQAIVAITTDAGFLGGLNMKVINAALEEAQKMPTTMIIIGARGKMYVSGQGYSTVNFPGIQDEERHTQAMQLRDYIFQKALANEFDTVKVVHPRAVSFGVQHIETVSFLPFRPPDVSKAIPALNQDIILESRPGDMIEYLVYLWMGEKLHYIFGVSQLAEFSARYIHLDESSEKLKDEDKKVRLEYFRVRHELADRALRELISGRYVRGKK
ncbi:MAG: F0F1 ATP synthase subunit gamma [Candidatus Omnitrophica bacterium]|nr:F0F1 ATP synthase subunit gamma [Candidatus Omnitrophota bacterium]